MVKRRRLPTRSFGAEEGIPEAPVLAAWIQDHRGMAADLTTYRLLAPLAAQERAGIATPCAGGLFYEDRLLAALEGIAEGRAVGELHVNPHGIVEDAAAVVLARKGSWCALPSPGMLGIADFYFHDPAEWSDAICGAYRTMMRSMRDTGIAGHVLICDTVENDELAALAWQKAFFFLTDPDRQSLARLLERQQQVAVRKEQLPLLFSLMDEYDLSRLFLIDPDPASIASVLAHVDPDRLVAAGYAADTDGEYWDRLAASAEFSA